MHLAEDGGGDDGELIEDLSSTEIRGRGTVCLQTT